QLMTHRYLEKNDNHIIYKNQPIKLSGPDHTEEMKDRFIKRLGETEESKGFLDKFKEYLSENNLEFNFLTHNDYFVSNIMNSENYNRGKLESRAVIIDYEKAGIGNPIRDIITLTANPSIEKSGIDTEEETKKYIDDFTKMLKKEGYQNTEKLKEQLSSSMQLEIMQNDLCQIGSKINQGKMGEAEWYTKRFIQHAPAGLKDQFMKYINSTKQENLKRII
ncbi:MAG: hypothetical protein ACQEP1_06070, partial [Nanobdellota archaeon]